MMPRVLRSGTAPSSRFEIEATLKLGYGEAHSFPFGSRFFP